MGWGWGLQAQTRARAVLVLFCWSSGRKGGAAGRDSGVASRLNRAKHRAQAACTVRGPQHCALPQLTVLISDPTGIPGGGPLAPRTMLPRAALSSRTREECALSCRLQWAIFV
ncbi:hypothetical protein BKA56DRAFT_618805 [Ilyonectria sp. MPI-CAGE-AT-0026]|nr:hypothetical protein BKA56DRAFT_618805 [Ilyonectria sp. MPI-CAGE-AT-0026]